MVIDAGIAMQDNLQLLRGKCYDYVCVSRAKIKDYQTGPNGIPIMITGSRKQVVTLEKVISEKTTDYLLKVHSPWKAQTERSMKNQFEERFVRNIDIARAALSKKGGIKKADKVERRIGRIIEKYPSTAKHYHIQVVEPSFPVQQERRRIIIDKIPGDQL